MLVVEIFTWFENIELHPLNRHAFLWKVHPILPRAMYLAKENTPLKDTSTLFQACSFSIFKLNKNVQYWTIYLQTTVINWHIDRLYIWMYFVTTYLWYQVLHQQILLSHSVLHFQSETLVVRIRRQPWLCNLWIWIYNYHSKQLRWVILFLEYDGRWFILIIFFFLIYMVK